MNAEELIRTAAKGNNMPVSEMAEADELQKTVNRLLHLDDAESEAEAAFNLKILLSLVYVAGKIRGKQDDRRRRQRSARPR